MSTLDELSRIAPPPPRPVAAAGNWDAVERELGTRLPTDYRALVEQYGYGAFCDFLHLFGPFFGPCPMASWVRGILDADRQWAAVEPETTFPAFPAPGGLLPWASTDNGDYVYFRTEGNPSSWSIIVRNPRSADVYEHAHGSVDFLAGWLSGAIVCPVFPGGLDYSKEQSIPPFFEEWRDLERATLHLEYATGGVAPPYSRRLLVLQRELAPVRVRGGFGGEEDEKRQVHFRATVQRWRLVYDTIYGHNIRLAVPRGTLEAATRRMEAAVAAMGCRIRSIQP